MSDEEGVVYLRPAMLNLLQDETAMLLPEDFGIQLICPSCRQPLLRRELHYVCRNAECRRSYAIIDQIPKLLVDDSEVLTVDDWRGRVDTVSTSR